MMPASIVLPRPTSSARMARPYIGAWRTCWATRIWWGSSSMRFRSRVIRRSKAGRSGRRSASRRRASQRRAATWWVRADSKRQREAGRGPSESSRWPEWTSWHSAQRCAPVVLGDDYGRTWTGRVAPVRASAVSPVSRRRSAKAAPIRPPALSTLCIAALPVWPTPSPNRRVASGTPSSMDLDVRARSYCARHRMPSRSRLPLLGR